MSFVSRLTRLIAALALTSTLAAPAALADRGDRRGGYDRSDRGGYDRGHRGHRGDYRGHDRRYRDHHRGDRGYRSDHGKRHYPRHVLRDHGFRHYDYGTAWPRSRYSGHKPYRYRTYQHTPRYYAPSRRIYTHRPVYKRYHAPRYRIGGYYHRHPQTVIIRDYGRYGLYHPPQGHHWVHDHNSGDAVLASIATGAIIGLVVGALSGY